MNVDAQLKAQNNGHSWRACEYRNPPRPHKIVRIEQAASGGRFLVCGRCPVSLWYPAARS
jgi:hypothetical protein